MEIALANRVFRSKGKRYSPLHTSPVKEKAAAHGAPVLSHDSVAGVWVDNLEEWTEIALDSEFLKCIICE